MLLSIDGTLVVQLVNFLIFLLVLDRIFLRPVGAAIARRRAYINSVAAEIEAASIELKRLATQAEERLAAARRAADETVAAARAEAQREAALIVADHQAQAAAIIQQAQASVGLEEQQARANEREIVESLARDMLVRAVGPELVA
jgi:F-type H+-transporting ATPase subunit b